jgi:hypothetical protein
LGDVDMDETIILKWRKEEGCEELDWIYVAWD